MDIFNIEKLSLFILFFVPGFISIKVWCLIVPSEQRKMSDELLEVISYSCINFAILSWLILIITNAEFQQNHTFLYFFIIFIILFVTPVLWPILVSRIRQWEFFRGHIIHPIPKAWDYFFKQGKTCFVLIHLKNGNYMGGKYGGDSFASSFPHAEDIYIEEVYKVNENGEFVERIDNTLGLWINKDNIGQIEFFEGLRGDK